VAAADALTGIEKGFKSRAGLMCVHCALLKLPAICRWQKKMGWSQRASTLPLQTRTMGSE